MPTETVYGLAANALDARACAKIFHAKGRPADDPLIIHVSSFGDVAGIAIPNDAARRLAQKFWPGPLTMVLPKAACVPLIVTAGRASVAVRSPSHPLLRRLLRLAGVPLAAPSANPFGYVSPTTAAHVRAGLGKKIRLILDGGPAKIGIESTIVDLRDPSRPRLLRPGAITQTQLERVLGVQVGVARRAAPGAQLAPGLLSRHYSPRTPLELHARLDARVVKQSAASEAWLFFARPAGITAKNILWLDARGDGRNAARRLFAMLRALDDGRFSRIHVELASTGPLAEAINDRLQRAAARG